MMRQKNMVNDNDEVRGDQSCPRLRNAKDLEGVGLVLMTDLLTLVVRKK